MSKSPRKNLLEMRKKDAEERQAAWNSLSPKQKLIALDRRLGAGVGAAKQRKRLLKEISEQAIS